jgi:hypothetical protein
MSSGADQIEFWNVRPANWRVRRRWTRFVAAHRSDAAMALEVLLQGPPFDSPDIGRLRGRVALTPQGDERYYYRISTEWVIEFVIEVGARNIKLTRLYQFPNILTP